MEGETLTITRSGMVARAAFEKDVEPLVIPLQAIHGVRLKSASRLSKGWLQLLVGGVEAPELALGTAASNGPEARTPQPGEIELRPPVCRQLSLDPSPPNGFRWRVSLRSAEL